MLNRSPAILATLVAGALSFMAMTAIAQDKVITHPQGETTLSGVPSKVLVQDWAAFDNLNALGVAVAGVPSSNGPSYLADAVPADAIQLGSLFEPDFEGIAAAEADVYFVAARSAAAYETSKDLVPTIDLSVNNGAIIEGVKANITKLGEIFDLQAKAEELNAASMPRWPRSRLPPKAKAMPWSWSPMPAIWASMAPTRASPGSITKSASPRPWLM